MKKLLHYLFPYLKSYWKLALVALLLSLPFSAIKGAQVWLVKKVVDVLAPNSSFWEALKYAGLLLAFALLNYPCRFFHFYLMRYVIDRAACVMRDDIYKKLQRLPLSFFVSNRSGNLVSNILNDTRMLSEGLKSLIDLVREPLTALVMLGMALYSDWQLTLVIFVVAPLFVVIFVKSGRKVRLNQEEVQEQLAHMTHSISEGISGQKIAKAFNLQSYIELRFKKVQDRFFDYQMRTTVVEENAHPLVELVGALAFAGVIIFAHYRIVSGQTTPGDFFGFVTSMALIMDPLRKYGQANVKVNQAWAAGDRLVQIMHVEEEPDGGSVELRSFKDSIEFDNVTFCYRPQDPPIIKNLSFTIRRGQRVGIVGLSGAGKSTIISLLLRLYSLQEGGGEIRIDGVPIQSYTLNSLRGVMGLVSQDLFLFHDTVRENIIVGGSYSEGQIAKALQVAGAEEFVRSLPHGLDTTIGERGTRLSGGQGQRITIARAILRNPQILLFDEATSALDNASEKVVQHALDRWSLGEEGTTGVRVAGSSPTVIAVAHRLTTVQTYDQILVMGEGELIESGTHHQLLERQCEYYRLWDLSVHRQGGGKVHAEAAVASAEVLAS